MLPIIRRKHDSYRSNLSFYCFYPQLLTKNVKILFVCIFCIFKNNFIFPLPQWKLSTSSFPLHQVSYLVSSIVHAQTISMSPPSLSLAELYSCATPLNYHSYVVLPHLILPAMILASSIWHLNNLVHVYHWFFSSWKHITFDSLTVGFS